MSIYTNEIKFRETPKTCRDCRHWDEQKKECRLIRCCFPPKRGVRGEGDAGS